MKEKTSVKEILNVLERKGHATRADIADELDCSMATVSKKVAILVKNGENIGFNKYGLFVYNREDMENLLNVKDTRVWGNRICRTLAAWAQRGNNIRPILIQARQKWGKELTKDERKLLKSNLLLITRVVDAIDLDEELKE